MILVITNVLSSISSLGTSRKQLQLHPELRQIKHNFIQNPLLFLTFVHDYISLQIQCYFPMVSMIPVRVVHADH